MRSGRTTPSSMPRSGPSSNTARPTATRTRNPMPSFGIAGFTRIIIGPTCCRSRSTASRSITTTSPRPGIGSSRRTTSTRPHNSSRLAGRSISGASKPRPKRTSSGSSTSIRAGTPSSATSGNGMPSSAVAVNGRTATTAGILPTRSRTSDSFGLTERPLSRSRICALMPRTCGRWIMCADTSLAARSADSGRSRRSSVRSRWPIIVRASRSILVTEHNNRMVAASAAPIARGRHAAPTILPNHEYDKAEMMTEAQVHKVRFEPVGIEMEVEEGETVLNAAFRQGISLMHGCKEGQCGSCKSKLIDGDIELLKYSTFALPDYESETGHVLLCRTHAYSDVSFELLNYDEDLLSRSIAVKAFGGRVAKISALTSDIRLLEIEIEKPLKFWAGQYVDLTLGDGAITRAFSMANAPSESTNLRFIIKKYPNGAFSSLLDGQLGVGDALTAKGPYGTCFRREERPGPMLLIGGGSGMSPLWSILADHIASKEQRPVRFFYGARTRADLFYLEELAAIAAQLRDFKFVPALSHAEADDEWDGETGFVHEVVLRHLREEKLTGAIDAYACGPTPMIDAVLPVLQMNGVEPDHIYFDKFTPAVR